MTISPSCRSLNKVCFIFYRYEVEYSYSLQSCAQQMEGAKNGFFVFSKVFFDLYTPQKCRHFVRFCGVFAAAQNFDTKGAAKGAAKGKF